MLLNPEPVDAVLLQSHGKNILFGSRVFVFDDAGKVLLLRRTGEIDSGKWDLPGGGIDAGESIEAGTHRELHEEAGLLDAVLKYLVSYSFSESGQEYTCFSFYTDQWSGTITLSHEHNEYKWCEYSEARELLHFVDLKPTLDIAINSRAKIFSLSPEDIQPKLYCRERGIAVIRVKDTGEYVIYDKQEVFGDRRVRFPGGGVDDGETWEVATRREVKEEVGLIINQPGKYIETIRHYYHWFNGDPTKLTPHLDHFFYYEIDRSQWDTRKPGIETHINCFLANREYILKNCVEYHKLIINEV
jgi:8-oxo-dGTP diphosphatase